MDFKTHITLSFTWGHPRYKNTVNGIYLDGELLLHLRPSQFSNFGIQILSGYWAPNSHAAAYAVCNELYGEVLAYQVHLAFEMDFMNAIYKKKPKKPVVIDLTEFNETYLSKIEYYDVEATIAWYDKPLRLDMQQESRTATFKFLRVPVTETYSPMFEQSILRRYFKDHVERYTELDIMHDHTVREVTYSRSIQTPAAQEVVQTVSWDLTWLTYRNKISQLMSWLIFWYSL